MVDGIMRLMETAGIVEAMVVLGLVALVILEIIRVRKRRMVKIRNASLTVEELENQAKRMSMEHSISIQPDKLNWPLKRMNDNYNVILSVYKALNRDAALKRAVPPAAEWLLDNFYIIEEQVKSIRRDLTRKSYRRLPVLKTGRFSRNTRVYAIAMELVAHVDGQIDDSTVLNYLNAYQSHHVLFDREIRIMPTMVRLALIENIRLTCETIEETKEQWDKADEIVEKWWSGDVANLEKTIALFKDNIRMLDETHPSFVEHLFFRLRRSGRSYSDVLRYIDEHLERFGTSTEQIAQKEHNAQAVCNVSMGNCVVSLKYVSSFNWNHVFESASFVEQILRQDPDGTYGRMDDQTRGHYLRSIEMRAGRYGVSEIHVAQQGILLAQNASTRERQAGADENWQAKQHHVGYYLIDRGSRELDESLSDREKPLYRMKRMLRKYRGPIYIGVIVTVTLLLTGLAVAYAWTHLGPGQHVLAVIAGLAILIPVSEIVTSVVNWVSCRITMPSVFPQLDLQKGIPENMRTMVVVPILVGDRSRVAQMVRNLERHYLANPENNLYFALLGAFPDARMADSQEDEGILDEAYAAISALNRKYAKEGTDIFYYYHRKNLLNVTDNVWTGWERKRGALMELNEMLLGSRDTSFVHCSHEALPPGRIEYVITLDADTVLPLGMAKKMIGTMAHPLNRPVINDQRGIVTEGYGLMQPRISFDIESSNRSMFSRIYTGQEGIDPYASAISDVYQDLFGEGIFTGKGIYDLRAFHQVMSNALPDNAILSHDLLEGSYVRAALVSELELVDAYPSKYNAYVARLYRWSRGDWQLLPWLRRTIQNRKNSNIPNPLSYVSIWKIGDNLRRSLVMPALLVLIFLGVSVLPGNSTVWLGTALGVLVTPLLLNVLAQFMATGLIPEKIKRHVQGFFGLRASLSQTILAIVFLPYQATKIVGAVSVTLFRVLVSGRNMLEWVTSADAEKGQSNTLSSYVSAMGKSALLGIPLVILSYLLHPETLAWSAGLMALWLSGPFVAYGVSRDDLTQQSPLQPRELEELRKTARLTWRYFEEFSSAKTNFLAPDNYQQDPHRGIAPRTSPTNIGMGLLASLSGRDFGYAGILSTLDGLDRTVTTIEKMEKWNGHLYNWYHTGTLEPLNPRYISTVDSGNLVGYLITLAQGMKDYLNRPLVEASFALGMRDTIANGLAEDGENSMGLLLPESAADPQTIDLVQWHQALEQLGKDPVLEGLTGQKWKTKALVLREELQGELTTLTPWIHLAETFPESMLEGDGSMQGERLAKLLRDNVILSDVEDRGTALLTLAQSAAETAFSGTDRWPEDVRLWQAELQDAVRTSRVGFQTFMDRYERLIGRIETLAGNTRFDVLYDSRRELFSIGFGIAENRLTKSYYDLLASEARQTSYIAIARGEVPPEHWSRLGRALTVVDHFKGLVSWSGTMFEYLMPLLIMRNYHNTLLDETYSFAIKSQKKYGKQRSMPWGVSESSFNSLDVNLDYQYKAIGVPWLGLKRGLMEDAVAAPYATFLALLVKPGDAFRNIEYLKAEGLKGPFGYYEAADYTPDRLNIQGEKTIIKSYMAHHQGMTLLALNNVLNGNLMQKRFMSDPRMDAARLLLQEKVPLNVVFTKENKEKIQPAKVTVYQDNGSHRQYDRLSPNLPKIHVLSNGFYSIMVSDRGTGYSNSKTASVTRWREDPVLDQYGTFFYIRNMEENRLWSAAYAPLDVLPQDYHIDFTADKASFFRRDGQVCTKTDAIVVSGDNGEIRRIKLSNNGQTPVHLELTSYLELVLADQNSDLAHPAFSNLFVRTEFDAVHNALIAHRRPRSEADKEMWIAHMAVPEGDVVGGLQYETDRMRFIGRGRSVRDPVMMEQHRCLDNTIGSVLDPVFSLRLQVKVMPQEDTRISFVSLIADSRASLMELVEKYAYREACDAAFWMAKTRSQVETKYMNIKAADMELYQDMISDLVFLSPRKRSHTDLIGKNRRGKSSLWPYGISGDRPVVLVSIGNKNQTGILYEVLKAHEYWRLKDLKVDLVILSQEEHSYTNPLLALIRDIVQINQSNGVVHPHGDVFVLNATTMDEADVHLLYAVARLVFTGSGSTMREQFDIAMPQEDLLPGYSESAQAVPPDAPGKPAGTAAAATRRICGEQLMGTEQRRHDNGLGGFSPEGDEYIIELDGKQMTPAPWSNIIANRGFGFMVTESGGGFTWCTNSRENKLTPWTNDPVNDRPGEVFYLKDEAGSVWSMTPLPIREQEPYRIRHGFGYTECRHTSHGISQSLLQYVPVEGTVKISRISLCNETDVLRRVSLTHYVTPVLGVEPTETARFLQSGESEGLLTVVNPYNREFPDQLLYMDTSEPRRSFTGNRKEFFGQGTLDGPDGLQQRELSNSVGIGLDPCAAMQIHVALAPGETREILFVLGMAGDLEQARATASRYTRPEAAQQALEEVRTFWKEQTTAIQVNTPDGALNTMLNGWLVYQVISCRLWARSAFYQAGGAFGFRDQLQDCLSVAATSPDLARRQILRHAARQFTQGDVLHWWHEPAIRGTRTRMTDDFLWLPYVVSEYVKITGDRDILQEQVPFLEGDLLGDHEHERYSTASVSEQSGSLYDHCIRAVDNGLRFGERGLPLMGGGDWNDGMNLVGIGGKGESVWLGWFLSAILRDVAVWCRDRKDMDRARRYSALRKDLIRSIEEHGWDGNWYKRAFFDDGTPLGSAENTECRIDSLAQTWAVLSGAGKLKRARTAMDSVDAYLVMREEGLVKLLTPPFDEGAMEPGYIRSYVPGVRENGGQYTHAAAWVIKAFAMLGDGDRAGELFGLLNPINHCRTDRECSIYKVEPYVVAADVYSAEPHVGRGGWTWYTGAAGWMYKAGLESIVGFSKAGNRLRIDPCIPRRWSGLTITYRYGQTVYDITVSNPNGVCRGVTELLLDGQTVLTGWIDLTDDQGTHEIGVTLGDTQNPLT